MPMLMEAATRVAGAITAKPAGTHWLLASDNDADGLCAAAVMALALCGEPALAWAPVALSGAVGDWQHMGGWQGWNLELVERARAAGHLRRELLPAFVGVTLAEALGHAAPAIPGLAGDAVASEAFLEGLQIDPDAEVEELDAESRTRLVSAVAARHLADGAAPQVLETLVRPADINAKLGASLRQVF